MLKLSIKTFEKKLGFKLKNNVICLGLDCATRTGYCLVETNNKNINIDWGYIEVKSPNVYIKLDQMYKLFQDLLVKTMHNDSKKKKLVIIEDVFFSKNVHVIRLLARIGMICYCICYDLGLSKEFLMASHARKNLNFPGNVKKDILHKQIDKKLKLGIKDVDCMDALVLALNGIISERKSWVDQKKLKQTKNKIKAKLL